MKRRKLYELTRNHEEPWFENSINELRHLQDLNISRFTLEALPDWLDKLTNLLTLNISNNRLETLPDALGQLTNLQTLNISNNHLKTLPDALGQLTNLQTLNISNNRLKTLPDALSKLTNLKSLNIYANKLETLPDALSKLTNLQSLDISGNVLKTLSDSLGQLTNLRALYLRGNNLETLPNSLGNLKSLRVLNLSHNRLTALPFGISELNLDDLGLNDNPLPKPLLNITGGSNSHNLKMYFAFLSPKPAIDIPLPKGLKTSFQQYFLYFNDYLQDFKGIEPGLEVSTTATGLRISINAESHESKQVREYFQEYLSFIGDHVENIKATFETEAPKEEREIALVRLQNQVSHAQNELRIANLSIQMLTAENQKLFQLGCGRPVEIKLPDITTTNTLTATQSPRLSNTMNLDLTIELPALQDAFAQLRKTLPPEDKAETAQLEADLDKLSSNATKEEVEKSGVLPRLRRFLQSAEDAESGLCKAIATGKKGVETAQKLGRAYNQIAQWVGIPQVPTPFLGKE